jgi:hypothetical protein
MDGKLKEAKQHFLEAGYGRFDLIEAVVSKEVLLMKPRLVLKHLCYLLEMEQNQFPYAAFVKWHHRYRLSNMNKKEPGVLVKEHVKGEEGDVFDFKPSDPFAKPNSDITLINFLK